MKLLRILGLTILMLALLVPSVLADAPSRGPLPAGASVAPLAINPVLAKPTIISSFFADPAHVGLNSVGYDDRDQSDWVSSQSTGILREFHLSGSPTGRVRTGLYADMAYDYSKNLMYQMKTGINNRIRTWNARTGLAGPVITDPNNVWNINPQQAVAYNADADTLFIGGSVDQKIYRLRGLISGHAGEILNTWDFTQPGAIESLAWLGDGNLAVVTNNPSVIYIVDASTMGLRNKFAIPGGGNNSGGGIDAQKDGTAWIVNKANGMVYHINLAVAVQTPAKGDVITAGRTYNVTWLATPLADHFKVKFSMDNGATWAPAAGTITGTTMIWQVPSPKTNLDGCRIKVVAFDADNANIGANTSGPFKIEAIKFTAPTAGASFTSGTPVTGTFIFNSAQVANSYDIYLTKDNGVTWKYLDTKNAGVPEGFTAGVPISFTYDLSVTVTRNQCAYKVVLKNTDGTTVVKGQSALFTLAP
jgi:hypothetical protein